MGPRSGGMSRTRVVTEGAVTPERRSAAKKRPIQGVRACDQERSSKAAVSLGTPATMTNQCSTLMAFCQCLYELENHSSAFTALGGWSGFRAYICGQPDLLYIAVDETEDQEKEAPVFLLEYVFDATLAYWRQCEAWLEHATGTVETSPLSLVSVRAFWVFLRDILEMLAQQVEQIMPTGVVTSILRWAPALVRALGQSKEPSDARSGVALRGALQALGLTLVRAIQRAPDAVARQACAATAKVIVRMLWPSEEAAVWVSVEWGLDRLQAVLDGMAAGSSSITGTRTGLLVLMREIERGLGTALELVRARAFVGTNTESLEAIQGTMQRAHCLVHDLQQRIVADESEPDELVESTPRKKETVSATCLGSSGTREEVSAPGFAQVGEQVAASSMGSCQNTTNAMDSTATVEVVTWSYLENAVQILRTKPAADWEKRVEALVFIEEQARRLSRTDLVEFLRQSSLRYALADQIHDLRSQVVRQACATSATLARALGDAFAETLSLVLVPALLRTAIVTIAVIAESARDVLRCVVKHARLGRSVIFLFQSLADPKSATSLREITAELLYLALAKQPPADVERHVDEWRKTIRIGLEDASACVRARMRHAFWRYVSLLCWQAAASADTQSLADEGGVHAIVTSLSHQLERDILQMLRPGTRRTLMEHCPEVMGASATQCSPLASESTTEQQVELFRAMSAALRRRLVHSEQQSCEYAYNKENASPGGSGDPRARIRSPLAERQHRRIHSPESRLPARTLGGALRVDLGPECAERVFHSNRPGRLPAGRQAPSGSPQRSEEQAPGQCHEAHKASGTDALLPRGTRWRPARRTVVTSSPATECVSSGSRAVAETVRVTNGNVNSTCPSAAVLGSADWPPRLERLLVKLERVGADWRARLDALSALEKLLQEIRVAMESSSMAAAAAAAASPNTMPVEQRPLEHERTVHLVACLHRCFAEKQSSVVQQAERVCLALLALAPDHLLPSDLEQALETYPLLGRLLNQWPRTQAVLAAFVPLLSLDGGMALWLRHCSMEALRNAPENAHPRLAERTLQFLDTCVRSTESSLVAWQQALLLVPTPTSGALYILVKRLETLQDRVRVKQPLVRRAAAQLWETLRTRLQPAHWASLTGVAAAGVAPRTPAGTALAPAHQTSPVANRHRLHYRLGAGTTKPEELESPQRQPPETPLQAHSPATGNHQPVVVWDSLDTLRQARLFWRDKAVGIDVTETVHEACTQARTLLAVAAQTDHDQAWLESALRTAIELVRHIGQALARSPPSPALTSADASPHPSTDPANALASEVLAGFIHWAIGVRQQAKIGSLLAVSANRLYRAVQSTYRQYGQPSPDAACI